MAGAELRVLGPLHLSVDGRDTALGTPMQRAVLGLPSWHTARSSAPSG